MNVRSPRLLAVAIVVGAWAVFGILIGLGALLRTSEASSVREAHTSDAATPRVTATTERTRAGRLDQLDAFDICKKFVKDRLKAPSTAKFRNATPILGGDPDSVRISGDNVDGPFTVVSTVDAENAFGAPLRSTFLCTVHRVSQVDPGSWYLDDLQMQNP
jgi:hypothetical protein